MKTGTLISGGLHGALILAAVTGGLDWQTDTLPEPKITTVTLVNAAELDLQSSAAPQLPMADMAQMAQPEITADSVSDLSAESTPTQAPIDQTEAPDSADASPDLSALLQPDQPDVVVDAPFVQEADPHAEAAPDLVRPALAGNELNAPTSMSRPPPPRNAPRIDTTAAAKPPEPAAANRDSQPEVTADPGETVPEPVQEASAPEEASTEITPEGQRDVAISAYAPQIATRPPARPRNLRPPEPQPEAAPATDTAAAEMAEAVNASIQAAQAATQTTPPVLAELTGPEKGVIGDALRAEWNTVSFIGQENFEQYVVRITVEINAEGQVEAVTPLEPANPQGIFDIAYRAARLAVFKVNRAGGIPLPTGKFPIGVTLVLRFDPASGEIGFN